MNSRYKNYLEKLKKSELIDIILRNKNTEKCVRNYVIVEDFNKQQMQEIPVMQAYTNLSMSYQLSEELVIKIVRDSRHSA